MGVLGVPMRKTGKRRRITADTALRLSRYFGNSAKFWLRLQDNFDIVEKGLRGKVNIQIEI